MTEGLELEEFSLLLGEECFEKSASGSVGRLRVLAWESYWFCTQEPQVTHEDQAVNQ